ncbi:hypothetical protein H4219_006294 [Mycoemilia scoparia]|uniref:JmjC domain-containing protein n=1 Tax=Mycoemilia scoparia TaxID=417184 RepID=A0A9W7ZPM9_9FUNG|nr:hypothetical protein H4219_006294 [Mycoemilia scoparia]
MEFERQESISVEDFAENYLKLNKPVLIGLSATSEWRARKEWVVATKDKATGHINETPNYDALLELFGDHTVTVAHCNQKYFSDQERTDMKFKNFINKIKNKQEGSMTTQLYCKDWHFVLEKPEYVAYTTPAQFSSDWLNIYCQSKPNPDDFRFFYMGDDRTWTPFHQDVYSSYSWSANICGEKHWTFILPGQNHLFTDSFGNTIYNIHDYDKLRYPDFEKAKKIELIQRPGECIFVPSNWWHQVENRGVTISINHNWCNAYNVTNIIGRLHFDYSNVVHALRDIQDMDGFLEQCQIVLKAENGMSHSECISFLLYIASVYLDLANDDESEGEDQSENGSDDDDYAIDPSSGFRPDASFSIAYADPYFTSQPSIIYALSRIKKAFEMLVDGTGISNIKYKPVFIPNLLETIESTTKEIDSVLSRN